MSLDGGYTGSLDHAIANLHIGRQQGREQGLHEGYQQGLQDGHQQGYESGWNAGVEAGNKQILQQMKYTRQHVADKERLQAQLIEQIELNAQLNAKLQEQARQYTDQLRQYNHCLVSMNSMRRALEDLTGENTPQAERAQKLFVEKYSQQVSKALDAGAIKVSPEKSAEFTKLLPQTQQFIIKMLNVR